MPLFDTIHHLDGIILATLIAGVGLGARLGIARPALWLACSAVSAYVSAYLHEPVAGRFKGLLEGTATDLAPPAALASTFLATYLTLFVASALVRKILRLCQEKSDAAVGAVGLRPLDRLAGAAVGCALAGLLAGTTVLGLALCPDVEAKAEVGGSRLRPHVASAARMALAAVPDRSRIEFEVALHRLERAGTTAAGQAAGVGLDKVTDRINDTAEQVERANQTVAGFRGTGNAANGTESLTNGSTTRWADFVEKNEERAASDRARLMADTPVLILGEK